MNDNINYYISNGIIHVVASGFLKYTDILDHSKKTIQKAREKGVNKYLIDHLKVIPDVKMDDVLSLSLALKEHGLNINDKVALLIPKNDEYFKFYSSYEISSIFQGNKIKIFFDKKEAENWLDRY